MLGGLSMVCEFENSICLILGHMSNMSKMQFFLVSSHSFMNYMIHDCTFSIQNDEIS